MAHTSSSRMTDSSPKFDPIELARRESDDASLSYCRLFPHEVEARLYAAHLLETRGDPEAALEETAQACLLDGAGADALQQYGRRLLKSGDFTRAEVLFAASLERDPDAFDALVGLSSLLYHRGEYGPARAALERGVGGHPLLGGAASDPDTPGILRVLGYENSAFHIIRYPDGSYASAVHGGHFSPDHLIDLGAWRCSILNILGGNTLGLTLPADTGIVLNTISDPDRERGALLDLALLLDRNPNLPVINDPRQVLQTTRDRNAARLGAIPGLQIAKTERLRWRDGDPAEAVREVFGLGFVLPIILRKTGSQTGDDTVLARSEADMERYFEAGDGAEHYAIQFHDMQRADGLFHKARVFFIDGQMYPVANLHHDGWSVHSGDRYSVMANREWTQQAERAFIADPETALGAPACMVLKRIAEIVDLDYFGIDFTLCEDGSVFVFEANASMRHNFDHAAAFPYTRPNLDRISEAFRVMVSDRTAHR